MMNGVKLVSLSLLLLLILDNNKLFVHTLKNGLAKTPPMGWLAWERFTCETDCLNHPDSCINSQLFKTMANRLVFDGYSALGYKYVNIDDCWTSMQRDNRTQELVPDLERFGGNGGLKELANHLHNQNLLLGIYGDCGTKTCKGYPGQLKSDTNLDDNYFDIDAETFFNWQIDSFKFDGCFLDPFKAETICPKMIKAIESKKRSILITCEWPFYMTKASGNNIRSINWTLAQESCNLWRYWDDIEDSWMSVLKVIDYTVSIQNTISLYHGPGSWFDPDQLIIGNYALSVEQAQSQMAIWSIWAAPLFMSNDLRHMKPEMASILKNRNLIDINQDSLGVFGLMVAQYGELNDLVYAFVKPVELIKNGCPSFAIVYSSRQTLGSGQWVSFPLRKLLVNSSIHIAADRYNQLYPQDSRPAGEFSGRKCLERLNKAMTRDYISPRLNQDIVQLENQEIYYDVFDLISDRLVYYRLPLNETLELWVKPSGVRAVKLVEWTPSGQGTSSSGSSFEMNNYKEY